MLVDVISTSTDEPLTLIGRAAGTSTDRSGKGDPAERALRCLRDDHMSVFEHASVTFSIRGISRACSHQLVRHRHIAVTELSQRYVTMDVRGDDDSWYVMPESMEDGYEAVFKDCMGTCAEAYRRAVEGGCRREDARYMLPGATKTNLTVTMNVRAFAEFLSKRSGDDTQWEIRTVAAYMASSVSALGGQWAELMGAIEEAYGL